MVKVDIQRLTHGEYEPVFSGTDIVTAEENLTSIIADEMIGSASIFQKCKKIFF
jgi:hypothetical protein